jgi:transposase
MSAPLVPDDLWEAIEPLLPNELPKPKGGRPRVPDRAALAGIVFVLRTGCPWRLLPKQLGCGSGTTCWRRLRDWQDAGVWERLHTMLLNWLGDEAAVDWSRASVDSLTVRAKRGASRPVRTPQTAASLAPSTTSPSIGMASRWPSVSPPPTRTMPPSCSRSSMSSHRSLAHEDDLAVLGSARPSCTPTRPTTLRTSAVHCILAASPHALPDAGSMPPSDWAGIAGWWSARSRGCWAVVAAAYATSAELTCLRDSCTWPAPWSASASSVPVLRRDGARLWRSGLGRARGRTLLGGQLL